MLLTQLLPANLLMTCMRSFFFFAIALTRCRTQGSGGYGQNIFANESSAWTSGGLETIQVGYAVTGGWYNGEGNNYFADNGEPSSFSDSFGHFTQGIWVGSSKIGCATQFCPSGTLAYGFGS